MGDVCSRPGITIRFYNLHASDIKGAMGEIASYHEREKLFPFFLVLTGCVCFGLSLAFPFCLPIMVLAIDLLLDLCDSIRST